MAVVLAAGGTGGHLSPAIAVAQYLKKNHIPTLLITDLRGQVFLRCANIDSLEVLPVENLFKNRGIKKCLGLGNRIPSISGGFSLLKSFFKARQLIKNASLVIGFGGYASLPTLLAARQLKIPYFLQEQNAILGKVQNLMQKKSLFVATSFERTQKLKVNQCFSGTPLRYEFLQFTPHSSLCKNNKLEEDLQVNKDSIGHTTTLKPKIGNHFLQLEKFSTENPMVLLILGGSQGAEIFDKIIPKFVELCDTNLRGRIFIIQQSRNHEEISKIYNSLGVSHHVQPYFDKIAEIMQHSHLAISRAGGSTISELVAMGLPTLFVPYPHAAHNHQLINAKEISAHNGSWFITQEYFTAQFLQDFVLNFFQTPHQLVEAAQIMSSLYNSERVEELMSWICQFVNKRRRTH